MTWFDAPLSAVLATYDADGSVRMTPVWYRPNDGAFELVIAEGDAKLRNLRRDPRCTLQVFEVVPPFRGLEARGEAELVAGDVTEVRKDVAGRYLGAEAGARYAAERKKPGVLVRISARPREWDLAAILPTQA